MASSGKKRTTMAKLNREARMRERRQDKEARKVARKHAAANPPAEDESLDGDAVVDEFGEQPDLSEAGVSQTP